MISRRAVVETDAIGAGTSISDFAIVRAGARLGRDVVIHPHVVIGTDVTIGDGVEIFPGAVIGREPKAAGAGAREIAFERRLVIGSGSSVGPHVVIYYDVEIGERCLIGDGASIREGARIGSRCLIGRYVTINYSVRIGDGTKIMDLTHITGNCTIGADVFISVNVGSANDNAIGSRGYGAHVVGPTVHDRAMIGVGASLLPGITIGEGAVVGAGAVVTRDVAAQTRVVGIPARAVRDPSPSG